MSGNKSHTLDEWTDPDHNQESSESKEAPDDTENSSKTTATRSSCVSNARTKNKSSTQHSDLSNVTMDVISSEKMEESIKLGEYIIEMRAARTQHIPPEEHSHIPQRRLKSRGFNYCSLAEMGKKKSPHKRYHPVDKDIRSDKHFAEIDIRTDIHQDH